MSPEYIRIGLATISLLLIISPTRIEAEPAAASGDEAGRLLQIVLLKERDMPSRGSNIDVEPLLRRRADVRLTVVDAEEIVRNGVQGDVFCNGHGEVYPVEIENRLFEFLQQGGGLLHLGGAPFETAMKRQGGKWVEVVRRMEERSLPFRPESEGPKHEPFDMFRARLGMMTYAPPYPLEKSGKARYRFDPAIVGSPETSAALPAAGIAVCSTIPMHAIDDKYAGRYSTAYLAKPVCREMHCAGWLDEPDGSPLLTSLALVKSWGNPYQRDQKRPVRPWAIFTGQITGRLPDGLLDAMVRWLACPVFLEPIDLPLATTRRGETVQAASSLTGRRPQGWGVRGRRAEVGLEAFKAGGPIRWTNADATIRGNTASMRIVDNAETFLRPIRFELIDRQGRVRDYVESAVTAWRPEKLQAGPKLTADGRYFDYRNGSLTAEASFLIGTNWQDRQQYGFTWHNPNGLRVARDALRMSAAGMRIVRSHYMMPGWMRTVPWQIYGDVLPGVYDQFELGPEISERHLRALEAHVMIFNSLGIVFQPSVYTLLPPHMGHPATCGGANVARLQSCPGLIDNQKRFARQMIERFGAVPGIAWDLVNEPSDDMTRLGQWLAEMKPIWGKTGQLVGIGTDGLVSNVRLGESADWHSVHDGPLFVGEQFHTGKPHLLHEAWVPAAATSDGEAELGHCMSLGVAITLRNHGAGVMPWNWNQFYTNWRYRTKAVELWDNDLGSCVHADATPRAGSVVLRNWAALLNGVSFDQRANRQVVFLYPKAFYASPGTVEYLNCLYQNRVPFRAVNDVDFAAADLGGAKLIVVPYGGIGYRQATWKRLREFAAKGGAVFAHNDTLMLDEGGQVAVGRSVTLHEGRERLGSGWFDWTMGWNFDTKDMTLDRLGKTFQELKLERYQPNKLPLLGGGEMRFREKLRTGRVAMKHDWNSGAKLGDRSEPTVLEIADRDGRLVRGWSDEGEVLECDGMRFSSPEQFFLIRRELGRYLFSGGDITITGCGRTKSVSFIDPVSGQTFDDQPAWRFNRGKLAIHCDGRQRLLWCMTVMPGPTTGSNESIVRTPRKS